MLLLLLSLYSALPAAAASLIATNLSSNLAQLNFVFNKARPLGKLEMKLAIKILA
jgi:hypothetical protein